MFVGGVTTALFPLPKSVDVRPTDDVVDLASTADDYAFLNRLRARGFSECTDEGAPLCRLVYQGIRVDFVATAPTGPAPTKCSRGSPRFGNSESAKRYMHDASSSPPTTAPLTTTPEVDDDDQPLLLGNQHL